MLAPHPFEETGAGLDATVGISLRPTGDDPSIAWEQALRGADVETRRRGLSFYISGDPA